MSWNRGSSKRPPPYGGGGRGRQPHHPPRFDDAPSMTELQVLTNQNRLIMLDNSSRSDFIQYKVTIKNGWFKKVTDEATGEEKREWGSKEIAGKSMENFVKSPRPWRIIKKFVGEHNFLLAYDGDIKAYSESANSGPVVGEEYKVQVKRDCEENDPDADKIRDNWYSLTFEETKRFPFADVAAVQRGEMFSEEITTMLNVILKSCAIQTGGMISLEPNSSSLFFPLQVQRRLLKDSYNRDKAAPETRDRNKILLSGLAMTVITHKDGAYVMTESVVKYANKEFMEELRADQRHREGASRVPLLNLDGRGASIAGVRINSAHAAIEEHTERLVEEAIGKLGRINIEYKFRSNKTGNDEYRLYKNKLFRKDDREGSKGRGERIIRSADDLKFTDKDGREWTVASYFENQYGIRLRYPKMPIIHIDDISRHGGGWFPVEMVYQAFGKSKENGEEIVTNILRYHDAVSGKKYIEEVGMKLKELSLTGHSRGSGFEDRMKAWHMQIDTTSVEETAKILKPPTINFENKGADLRNGSFNLNRVQFSRPAKLASFAVANFTHNDRSCNNLVKTLTKVARDHGMEIPSAIMDMTHDDRYLDLVTVHYNGQHPVDDALDVVAKAIRKAKYFHLYDSQGIYRKKNTFYQTHCFSGEQEEFECLVLPPDNEKDRLGLLLDYKVHDKHYFSHQIETHGGEVHDARLMVKIRETNALIDPLDFRYQNGRHQACRRNGEWRSVGFLEHCYFCPKTNVVIIENEIKTKTFKHFADDWEVDFPSILIAYKPTDDKPLYDRIKVVSNYFGGVQSQCAVMKKFEEQRNKDQYASNIATKMNAKLSTIWDKAISWTSTYDGNRGEKDTLPWVGDAPTMVLGLGMAHGMGKYAKSVIAASLCLDNGCMRLSHSCYIQRKADKKSDAISQSIMKDIIKESIDCYSNENNGRNPERLWLQRDGLSDGNFKQADIEIEWIKEALVEKVGHSIPVTFHICQSQQLGFRMAPSVDRIVYVGKREKIQANVPSGTELDCGPDSFYMIAQGGLKGTSKPVKHVVYLNENESPVNGHSGLTFENLKDCTYQMCWKYPTATKAVRELPTIKYAKRLANQVLSSLSCLEEGYTWFGKYIKLVCPEGDTLTEEERRPYLEILNEQGEPIFPEHRQFNIVDMPFRNHLAA